MPLTQENLWDSAQESLAKIRQTTDLVPEVEAAVTSRGGRLSHDLEEMIWVDGDARALRLLLDNLMDNALKYSDEAPDIEVHLAGQDGFALLRIVDGGTGFTASGEKNLFRRFRRGDTEQSGVGLGLPLARAIARGHDGEVHLLSRGPGKGAVAEVWLPLVSVEDDG